MAPDADGDGPSSERADTRIRAETDRAAKGERGRWAPGRAGRSKGSPGAAKGRHGIRAETDRAAKGPGPTRSLYFRAVNAEFNWWLLIVGLVVGAGIAWFVLMDSRRREVDIDEQERPREALWLSRMLSDEGHPVSADVAERLLVLHDAYLDAPPPDDPEPADAPDVSARPEPSEFADDDRVRVERRAPDIGQ